MKINAGKLATLIVMFCFISSAYGQNDSYWKPATQQRTNSLQKEARTTMPDKFNLFELNTSELIGTLESAPNRKISTTSNTIVTLPTHEGKLEQFRVFEASNFSDELQAKYPNINSYAAQGIDDPSSVARFSVSDIGVHVMIYSPNFSTVYVDPYTMDKTYYMQYSRSDVGPNPNPFECHFEDTLTEEIDFEKVDALRNADDGMLRTFRLALACTGEYSIFHLNNQGIPSSATDEVKKAAVLMAMNTSMMRVNGVFERDLALTMEIIANNTDIIFLNPATDGYTNNDPFALLGENQAKCDNVIGNANYDIGHVFSTQGGGVATLNSPCNSGIKARGVTGIFSPIGDFYDIDYVAHEMGHQFGAQHPQNNNCQRSASSIEPGSASTIMGYAGICSPNVQNNSDDYFNGRSIIEMWNHISTGSGTCANQTATNNDPPTSNAGPDKTIPISTPFILRGEGTDPNTGDVLSYCWEQNQPQVGVMPPQPTNPSGPMFRSLDPQSSPDRYMPEITTVLGGSTQSTWEVVPSVSRLMIFRLTVRDNVANGAASASDQVVVTTDDSAGPFLVTSQTTNEDWEIGTTQTVTWDVANTDVAPVDAPNVDIIVSIDGGLNYEYPIGTAVPNNGSYTFTVPNIPNSTSARVMVAGADHLFYNINSTDFETSGILSTNDFQLEDLAVWPNPSQGSVNLSFVPVEESVTVSLYDVRGRKVNSTAFTATTGSTFTEAVDYSAFQNGMYFVKIENGDAAVTKKLIIE